MYELMLKGGPVMWPLLACSIVALAVVFERLLFWISVGARKNQPLINRIFTLTEEGDFDTAIREGESSKCLVVRILTAGLAHRNYGLAQSLEAAAMSEIEKMKRSLSVLDTIITLAPLLGILGTVTGMINVFEVIAVHGSGKPDEMAHGISQALLTTASGLIIAIPVIFMHHFLSRRVNALVTITGQAMQLIQHRDIDIFKKAAKS